MLQPFHTGGLGGRMWPLSGSQSGDGESHGQSHDSCNPTQQVLPTRGVLESLPDEVPVQLLL